MRRILAFIILGLLVAGCRGYSVGVPVTPTLAPTRVGQQETSTAVWATYDSDGHLPTPTPRGTLPPTPAITIDAFMLTLTPPAITITVDNFMLTPTTQAPTFTPSPASANLSTPTPVVMQSPTLGSTALSPTQVSPAVSATGAASNTAAYTATFALSATLADPATAVPSARTMVTSAMTATGRATLSDADLFKDQGTQIAQLSTSTPGVRTSVPSRTAPTVPTSTLIPFSTSAKEASPEGTTTPVQDLSRPPASTTPVGGSVSTAVSINATRANPSMPPPKATGANSRPVNARSTPDAPPTQGALSLQPDIDPQALLNQWRQGLPVIPSPPPARTVDWPVYTQDGVNSGSVINPARPCTGCTVYDWPYTWDHIPPTMDPGLAAALVKRGSLPAMYYKTAYPGSDMYTLWVETVDGVSAVTIIPGQGAFQGTPCINATQCLK